VARRQLPDRNAGRQIPERQSPQGLLPCRRGHAAGGLPALFLPPELTFGSRAAFVARLEERIAAAERSAAAQRKNSGHGIIGPAAVRAHHWNDSPRSGTPRRVLDPRIACKNTWRRIEALARNKVWLEAYRRAREAFIAGTATVFPIGTFWLRRTPACRRNYLKVLAVPATIIRTRNIRPGPVVPPPPPMPTLVPCSQHPGTTVADARRLPPRLTRARPILTDVTLHFVTPADRVLHPHQTILVRLSLTNQPWCGSLVLEINLGAVLCCVRLSAVSTLVRLSGGCGSLVRLSA
jgi:hypothetical protein